MAIRKIQYEDDEEIEFVEQSNFEDVQEDLDSSYIEFGDMR